MVKFALTWHHSASSATIEKKEMPGVYFCGAKMYRNGHHSTWPQLYHVQVHSQLLAQYHNAGALCESYEHRSLENSF